MIKSQADENIIIFIGTHGINWKTKDCGVNIQAMNQGRKVKEFQLHPVKKDWLLASAYTNCGDFEGEPCKIYNELFVSFDLGENWEFIQKYVYQFSWFYNIFIRFNYKIIIK